MSPYFKALLFSLPVVVASLVGGWLPTAKEFTHAITQVFLSFVSGFMIGIAVLHILPHGIDQIASVYTESSVQLGALSMVCGIVLMFGTLRLLSFHDHEPVSTTYNAEGTARTGSATWIAVIAGMSVHTLFEGFAIGSILSIDYVALDLSTHTDVKVYSSTLALGVVFAIVVHKPFDALTVVGVTKYAGVEKKSLWLTNVLFALICPFAALIALFFLVEVLHDYEHIVGFLLAFVSGVFLCVALADLLPEAFRHQHDRLKIFIAFLCGLLLTWISLLFLPHMH
ncbi:MAG: hypothetical protein F4227_09460 [Gammaproteobacteria bacterium]|nr:hypothetical protein [Gammaproteobacteria bacterium]MYF03175.1 hypothetical protein [Gammaproteobacteria bacterium]MYI77495.1 hypothetical protein [Gammaproteobacteria bacterium]